MLRFATIVIGSIVSFPAAACDYCTIKVVLDKTMGTCFLERVDEEILSMKSAGLPAQLVNLASCEGVSSGTRGTGGLPVVGPPTHPHIDMTPSFLLDEMGLVCLAKMLGDEDWEPDQIVAFEPMQGCEE